MSSSLSSSPSRAELFRDADISPTSREGFTDIIWAEYKVWEIAEIKVDILF